MQAEFGPAGSGAGDADSRRKIEIPGEESPSPARAPSRRPVLTTREVVAIEGLIAMFRLCPPQDRLALRDDFDRFGWLPRRLAAVVSVALERLVELESELEEELAYWRERITAESGGRARKKEGPNGSR